jgi:hypothetical protein
MWNSTIFLLVLNSYVRRSNILFQLRIKCVVTTRYLSRVLLSTTTYGTHGKSLDTKFFLDSVCVSHVTNMIEGKTYHVTACEPDQNKSTKIERESTTRKPWASLAMAASVGYAPPTCVPAR